MTKSSGRKTPRVLSLLAPVLSLVSFAASPVHAQDPTANWVSAVLGNRCPGVLPAVRSAANAGDAAALEIEAAMYDRGCGVIQNMSRAEQLYASAIAHGAEDGIASGYVDLFGPKLSEAQGIAELTQAAASGNRLAPYHLFFYYQQRFISPTTANAALVLRWVSAATNLGDAAATAEYAGYLLSGAVVKQDVVRGRQYADRALATNVANAYDVVGLCHLWGSSGYPTDRAEGIKMIRKAIALGLTSAKMDLARNADASDYTDGRVSEAEMESYARDSSSVLAPSDSFTYSLASFWYLHGGHDVVDCAHALPLLLKVADGADGDADFGVSYCYANGDGVAENQVLAKKYLAMALQKGSANAIAYVNSQRSAQQASSSNQTVDRWHDYEGYHWSQLHPMSGQGAPH